MLDPPQVPIARRTKPERSLYAALFLNRLDPGAP
jgi:hypothetical protein